MVYLSYYTSPIGKIILVAKNNLLIGLWFENQKYYLSTCKEEYLIVDDNIVLNKTKKWLDSYFKGENPSTSEIPLQLNGTKFQKEVWELLSEIPYGTTKTYGEIAKKRGLAKFSSRAVGNAIGHNPISILIPCHRVLGRSGNITGYAGGIDKKIYLLRLEDVIL